MISNIFSTFLLVLELVLASDLGITLIALSLVSFAFAIVYRYCLQEG